MKMEELCSTCLSKHRALVSLSSIEVQSSHIKTISFAGSPVLVCWECSSRLQKMQAFRAQATKAQELLKLYVENQKPLKALKSLSRLSQSRTKTDYDENFVYCMKQEAMECEDEIDVKFDTQELIPKAEKIDINFQKSYQTEDPDKDSLYVTVEPLTGSGDGDGYDSDEWPLSEVRDKKVDHKNESDIKTEQKKHKTEQKGKKLSKKKGKDNFTIKIMTFEEMHRLREEDRRRSRFMSAPFKCATCISGFHAEDKYNGHVLKYHSAELGPHSCDICLARHKTAELLSRHRETHLYRYHCRDCPFNSHKLQWMLVHQSKHKVQKFTCELCGFSTLNKGRLGYHIKNMHTKHPSCETCGKEFVSGSNLTRHVRMKHGDAKLEKCTICGGMYRYLASHLRSHAPPAPDALCVECGVSFTRISTLRKHLLLHSKHRQQNDTDTLKSYVCDECDRRFTNKTCLDRHTASQHTKQYPFNCDICHKGFLRRDRLKNHILERHEGGQRPRKNVCSYCGKAFKTKEVLINHIRTHTGERPFQCPHCPWSFAQRVTLRTHMRGLHPATGNTDVVTGNTSVVTGNTGSEAGSGNTQDGGKRGKGGKRGRAVITESSDVSSVGGRLAFFESQ